MPQERDYLNRAAAAYQQALDLYNGIAAFSGVPASVRRTQAGLERVKQRLSAIDGSSFDINLGPLGTLTIQKGLTAPTDGADQDDQKETDHKESNDAP